LAVLALTASPSTHRTTRSRAAGCHLRQLPRTDGRSVTREVPALAGSEGVPGVADEAFQEARPRHRNAQLAKGYTDAQIDLLAGTLAQKK